MLFYLLRLFLILILKILTNKLIILIILLF